MLETELSSFYAFSFNPHNTVKDIYYCYLYLTVEGLRHSDIKLPCASVWLAVAEDLVGGLNKQNVYFYYITRSPR
jgi:hypothetical protein